MVAAAGLAANTRLDAPPRFDGAGYAVLARSLASGQGYREIDHPDRPRHAHFPPGYPLALAALWRITGVSAESAHLFSAGCTLLAIGLIWRWLEGCYPARTAWLLALALACNWRWQRDGGAIQSEPLFNLLTALALLATERAARRGRAGDGVLLGLVLGAGCLTRHVGVGLAIACWAETLLRGQRRAAALALLTTVATILPWAAWLARVGRGTQVGLIPRGGFVALVADQALFYLRRLPDQITGPFVEIATVFRPELAIPATIWAGAATAVIVAGWMCCLRSPRRRLVGWVPLMPLPILLVWPFTEAGRFLVPLVPFILVGAQEGLATIGDRLRRKGWPEKPAATGGEGGRTSAGASRLRRRLRSDRRWAAAAVVGLSVPYSLYAALTDRAGAQRRQHADFDAACAWMAHHADRPGPVLTRHPGEVFGQTGRTALGPGADDLAAIDGIIERYGVVYVLVDDHRYARAPTNPLERYVAERPGRVALVWRGETAAVYELGPRR